VTMLVSTLLCVSLAVSLNRRATQPELPALCQDHVLFVGPAAVNNLLQTTADCGEKGAVDPFKTVSWKPSGSATVSCDDCSAIVSRLMGECRAEPTSVSSRAMIDRFYAGCDDKASCNAVVKGVRDLFCPQDACAHLRMSSQWSPTAVCSSAAIDCDGLLNRPTPPEKALYDSKQMAPPAIPPKSCVEYVEFIAPKCSRLSLPQWRYCEDYDGFQREGCEHVANALALLAGTHGDICAPLFTRNATTNQLQPRGASQLCLGSLGMRDKSPVRLESWDALLNKTREAFPSPSPFPSAVSEILPISPSVEEALANATESHIAVNPVKQLAPCVDAPTPTPLPRGIVSLIPKPIGYRTLIEKKPLISFTCDASSSWVIITPKLGCSFQDWSVKQAGVRDLDVPHQCKCRCSGQVETCGRGAGSWVHWTDVRSAEDCAKMICSNDRFAECAFEQTTVAADGNWNGDKVRFNSIALQETCTGLTGTTRDFCGIVGSFASQTEVSDTLGWILRNSEGVEVTRYTSDLTVFGKLSSLEAHAVWIPCGNYTVELVDRSWNGHGWQAASLSLKDDALFEIWKSFPQSAERTVTLPLEISDQVIAQSRLGLCTRCRGAPHPCFRPHDSTANAQTCVPFIEGARDCPIGTARCDADILA